MSSNPDPTYEWALALASGDNSASIIDARTGERTHHIKGMHTSISSVAWSPNVPETEPVPPEGLPPTASSGVEGWTEHQVAGWLRDVLKFEDVAQVATEQGVDGATATEMDKDDWKELGVTGFKAAKVVAQLKKLV